MAKLVDTNLWIGLTRAKSPRALKAFIALQVLDPQACLAEPVIFEVLRSANDIESRQLTAHFQSLPLLASPTNLWTSAVDIGRACRCAGTPAGSTDLLIATIAIHHGCELITFDADFERIADVSKLKVKLLKYPPP